MPEEFKRILLDQNIPQDLLEWLKEKLPGWKIQHVIDNQKIRVRKPK